METPPGSRRRSGFGRNPRAAVLGSLTIEGQPSQVAAARAFVARTLSTNHLKVDSDAATLLTSEIVTNAIKHTKSGVEGGVVTILVVRVLVGVLVEVIDDGSAGVPIVKGDLYAAEGHGLFLVQQIAAQWGYLRDPVGTTVWFHLPAPLECGPPEDEPPEDEPPAWRGSAAALAAERTTGGCGAVRAMHLACSLRAVRARGGVLGLLAVQHLAELALHLVEFRLAGRRTCLGVRGGRLLLGDTRLIPGLFC
jgi:anti-sigma regulatory factor (Ser/Thr protein kinase)